MTMPRWLARVNKRVFNRIEIRRGKRPVLIHVGRSSGATHQTPLDAHRLPDGYLFIPMYGPKTDWVKNVLQSGTARLRIEGRDVDLVSPRMVRKDAIWPLLPATTKVPPGISGESPMLVMDVRQ